MPFSERVAQLRFANAVLGPTAVASAIGGAALSAGASAFRRTVRSKRTAAAVGVLSLPSAKRAKFGKDVHFASPAAKARITRKLNSLIALGRRRSVRRRRPRRKLRRRRRRS